MQSLAASLGSGECVSRAQIWRILRPQRTLEALSAHSNAERGARHFTQGMPSEVIRVRSEGVGSFVPVPVAATVVTGAAAVVVGDVDV